MSRTTAVTRLPSDRLAVSICGVGGQGVVIAGVILGEAACGAGLWACQSASYTVAARGGFARSEVIVAPEPEACPLAEELDLVVGLDDTGWIRERARLRAGGLAICDEGLDPARGEYRRLDLPLGRLAAEAGGAKSANLVALGALAAITGLVDQPILAAAVCRHLGDGESSRRALAAGFAAGAAAGADGQSG